MGKRRNRLKTTNGEDILRKFGKSIGWWKHGYALKLTCYQIYEDYDFNGKNILEIGCGKGINCIWASIHGANHVVGLEPLTNGSFDSSQIYEDIYNLKAQLNLTNIEIVPYRIQDYEYQNNYFDIILSVASINHLDEKSCIYIRDSEEAKDSYSNIFRKLNRLMKKGGKLIIIDASSRNFFGDIGIVNPFVKNIERFKHLEPGIWAGLLAQSGFKNPKITWTSGRKLKYLRIYSINKCLSYFMDSIFRLEMNKG